MNYVAAPSSRPRPRDAHALPRKPPPVFRRSLLQQQTFKVWLKQLIFNHSGPFFAVARVLSPVFTVPLMPNGRLTLTACITRAQNVRDILNNPTVFNVPYKARLENLSENGFLLGKDDRAEHQADLTVATAAFPLSDIPHLAKFAAGLAQAELPRSDGEIDVIAEFARPILAKIAQNYLGVSSAEKDFPFWAMAVSAYLIEPLGIEDPLAVGQAQAGAFHLRTCIDNAIENDCLSSDTTIPGIGEFVVKRLRSADVSKESVEALLGGVIAAIIPTGILAIGHIMEMLLKHRNMMTEAQRAAQSGDPELLRRCLFEVLRFKPIIPVWPRVCVRDFELAVDGKRSRRILAGTRVLVSTQSAMRDRRQVNHPRRFDIERPASNYLHFGAGLHACLGAAIASAVIPAILRPLLLRKTIMLGPEPRTFYAAVFPDQFPVVLKYPVLGE